MASMLSEPRVVAVANSGDLVRSETERCVNNDKQRRSYSPDGNDPRPWNRRIDQPQLPSSQDRQEAVRKWVESLEKSCPEKPGKRLEGTGSGMVGGASEVMNEAFEVVVHDESCVIDSSSKESPYEDSSRKKSFYGDSSRKESSYEDSSEKESDRNNQNPSPKLLSSSMRQNPRNKSSGRCEIQGKRIQSSMTGEYCTICGIIITGGLTALIQHRASCFENYYAGSTVKSAVTCSSNNSDVVILSEVERALDDRMPIESGLDDRMPIESGLDDRMPIESGLDDRMRRGRGLDDQLSRKKREAVKHFKCDYCPYRAVKMRRVQEHQRVHTGEKPYTCRYCEYRTSYRSYLPKHEKACFKRRLDEMRPLGIYK